VRLIIRNRENGAAGIEFALTSVVWIPLILGTLVIGTNMIRALQTIQVARDTGHMYARGVDFSMNANQQIIARLAQSLGSLNSSTGTPPGVGVVILSSMTYVGRWQCKARGFADASNPPNPTGACTNYGHFVFSQRVVIGNTTLRSSKYGRPTSYDSTTGYVADYVTDIGARADTFNLLPKPKEDGTDGFQAGQFAYLVEAYFKGFGLTGVWDNPGTYAHAIF
jgi:hypothetical protein